MREDIFLDNDGDIKINTSGDIALTESVRQAVQIRLRWFFSEWRFAPDFGVPWFEEVFIKNPNDLRIRQIIREHCMSVEGVKDALNIALSVDPQTRGATISLKIVTEKNVFTEEVKIII